VRLRLSFSSLPLKNKGPNKTKLNKNNNLFTRYLSFVIPKLFIRIKKRLRIRQFYIKYFFLFFRKERRKTN